MAEAILRSFDKDLEIFSAGIDPVDHVSSIAMEVMAEVGIGLQQNVPKHYSEFADYEFDYLITVGESTHEELEVPEIKYKRKLHLGVHSPYKNARSQEEIRLNCREVRDELMSEMDYFYFRIIKKSVC